MAFSWKSTSKCYLQFRKQQTSFLRLSPKVVTTTQSSLLPVCLWEKANGMSNQFICFSLKYSELTFSVVGW